MQYDNKIVLGLIALAIMGTIGIILIGTTINKDELEHPTEINLPEREEPKEEEDKEELEEEEYLDLDEASQEEIDKHKVDEEPEEDSFREGFMDGCVEEGGENKEYCSCV